MQEKQQKSAEQWRCRGCGEQLQDLDAADMHNGKTGHYVVPTEQNEHFGATEEI